MRNLYRIPKKNTKGKPQEYLRTIRGITKEYLKNTKGISHESRGK